MFEVLQSRGSKESGEKQWSQFVLTVSWLTNDLVLTPDEDLVSSANSRDYTNYFI